MNKKPVAAWKSSFELIDSSELFSHINIKPSAQVLDLACGGGRYSIEISRLLGAKGLIHAVDMWDEGIETLQNTIRERGITTINPILADITKHLPLESESVDFCLMATILHDLSVIFHDHSATCFSRPFHQARRSELCRQPITG